MITRYSGYERIKQCSGYYNLVGIKSSAHVSEHFKIHELKSKGYDDVGRRSMYIHPVLIMLLEEIRNYFNQPVVIHSAYRSKLHNRLVGGAEMENGKGGSYHLYGMAADFHIKNVNLDTIFKYLDQKLRVGGIGRYDTFLHVDVGEERRWDNRT